MIRNAAELAVVQEQMQRLERIVQSLRNDLFDVNRERFWLMSSQYIESIQELRQQVDAYLGIEAAAERDAMVVISLQGEEVRLGELSAGVMTRVIDAFRRGLQSVVELVSGRGRPPGERRRPRWIENLCDLPLLGLAPGSVQVQLGEPEQTGLFSDDDRQILTDSLKLLFQGFEWAATDRAQSASSTLEDEELRHAILSVVRNLLPPRSGPIESIGFRAMRLGYDSNLQLRRTSRNRLNEALAELEDVRQYTEVRGTIREVDLDARTFELRERPGDDAPLRCEYSPSIAGIIGTFLGEPVIVTGELTTSRKTRLQTMQVESIESDAPAAE